MFDIQQINFSNGVFNNQGKVNGAEVALAQIAQDEENIISSFEKILQSEFNPYTAFEMACKENNLTPDNFSQREFERLQSKVSAIYQAKMNKDRRFY
jgi:hypothetical protein